VKISSQPGTQINYSQNHDPAWSTSHGAGKDDDNWNPAESFTSSQNSTPDTLNFQQDSKKSKGLKRHAQPHAKPQAMFVMIKRDKIEAATDAQF